MHPDHFTSSQSQNRLKHIKRMSLVLLFACTLLIPVSLYVFSPYWVARQVLSALQSQDIVTLNQKIPRKLLTHLITNIHPEQKWQGAGSHYLHQVWPRLYQEIDREVWLSLYTQTLNNHEMSYGYQRYFDQYALDLGQHHDQIRIEFERTSFIHWRVKRVCYPNPQPELVVNRCPSSKR